MQLPKDPMMLYSVVNLKLRDQYSDLDAFCEGVEVDRAEIEATLGALGFQYDEITNQFK